MTDLACDQPLDLNEDLYELEPDELVEMVKGLREQIDSYELDDKIMKDDMRKYRERLERRDAKIYRMTECLRAIAHDDSCGAHHDSMAREALTGKAQPELAGNAAGLQPADPMEKL